MNVPPIHRLVSGLIVGAALLLAACGQKGPLYLPDTGGEVVTRPAGATQSAPQQTPQQASPETAPQPSTQPPQSTTPKPEDDKKSSPPR